MTIFAVYNLKGGVGKTASAVNLAYLSARGGARTLLWDLDPQGAATFYFRVRPKVKGGARRLVRCPKQLDGKIRGSDFDGLDVLPADFSYRSLDIELHEAKKPARRLRRLLDPLRSSYDHVVLDCAPGGSLVSDAVLEAADVLIVPTIPTPLSLRTLALLVKHVRNGIDDPPRVVSFFSMVDRRKAMHRDICNDPRARAVGFCRAVIPYSSVVEQMGIHRAPLPHTMPRHRLSVAFGELWAEILAAASSDEDGKPPAPKRVRRMLDDAIHPERRGA
ncbi:MAG: ParA family protein [Planctomycetota bacterium]